MIHCIKGLTKIKKNSTWIFSALYCFYYISTIFIILQNCLDFTYLQMIQTSFMNIKVQENVNSELINIHTSLCANKLSLNIEKSNFILFHSPQMKVQDSYFNLKLCNKQLKREYCIKYLGILIDSHLNGKKTSWIYRSKSQEKYWHLMQVKTLC